MDILPIYFKLSIHDVLQSHILNRCNTKRRNVKYLSYDFCFQTIHFHYITRNRYKTCTIRFHVAPLAVANSNNTSQRMTT